MSINVASLLAFVACLFGANSIPAAQISALDPQTNLFPVESNANLGNNIPGAITEITPVSGDGGSGSGKGILNRCSILKTVQFLSYPLKQVAIRFPATNLPIELLFKLIRRVFGADTCPGLQHALL